MTREKTASRKGKTVIVIKMILIHKVSENWLDIKSKNNPWLRRAISQTFFLPSKCSSPLRIPIPEDNHGNRTNIPLL